jgi:DHA1 family bicyclomycin/chloramphenicol resistance-like MFS transporter
LDTVTESPPPSASEASPQRPPTPWRLLALLVTMSSIGPTALTILVPAVPVMAVELSTSPDVLQLTVSLYLVCLAVAQLLLGTLSDRFGRRPVIIAGLSLTALTSLAAIAATSVTVLIVVRSLQAFGASTGQVIGRAMVRDLYERERAAAMIAWVTMAVVVAPIFAPLAGGLLAEAFGWPSIFVFLAAWSVLVVIWAMRSLPETRRPSSAHGRTHVGAETRMLLGSPLFIGYVLTASLGCGAFFVFLGGSSYVVVDVMKRSPIESGVWLAVTSIGYMLGNYGAARASQRFGVPAMVKWGLIIEVLGTALTAVFAAVVPDAGPALIFLPQLVIQFGNGVLLPNAIAGAVSVRPQAAGTASGVVGFAQMAFGAVAAQGVTYVHTLVGATTALPLSLSMLFFAAIALAAYYGLVHRRQAD